MLSSTVGVGYASDHKDCLSVKSKDVNETLANLC
jgi:hypothetical protein